MSGETLFDRTADALAHPYRRQLLVALTQHNPQVVEEGLDEKHALESLQGDEIGGEDAEIELTHHHLLTLEDYGYIRRDEITGTISTGQNWGELEPFLRSGVLPKDEYQGAASIALDEFDGEHRRDASNVLVLSPLAPSGADAYTESLASSCSERTSLVVVTYTQTPSMWLADWREQWRSMPDEITFIHGGPVGGDDVTEERVDIETRRVDPRDPMDVITAVTAVLEASEHPGDAVVSVQTLSVLLEYVEFDTAFRYLHVLIHRLRNAGAIGYYQMDPDIHEAETINTLSVLFDIVVQAQEETTGIESPVPKGPEEVSTETEPSIPASLPPDREGDWVRKRIGSAKRWWIDGWRRARGRLRALLTSPEWGESNWSVDQEPRASETGREGPVVKDQSLLTDEERIEGLLLRAGGRMSQADIVENTHWSGPSVSRKLLEMEDAGLITRVQVGRGNLVFLDGHQPDIAKPRVDRPEVEP